MKRLLISIVAAFVSAASVAGSYVLDYRAARLDASAGRDSVVRSAFLPRAEQPADASVRPQAGDVFAVKLFEDVEYSIRITNAFSARSFAGRMDEGTPLRCAVIVMTPHGLQLDIRDVKTGLTYSVASTASGTRIREMKPLSGRRTTVLANPVTPLGGFSASQASLKNDISADPYVDMLIVFDANAAAWAFANGYSPKSFAEMQVAKMNSALANTGLDRHFTFRLRGVMTLPGFIGSDTAEVVQYVRFSHTVNGVDLGAIHAKRDAVGADIVSVLIDTGMSWGTTGTGYSLENAINPSYFAENAYNACAIRAVGDSHTMTHEVGHNMGAGHSDIQMSSPGPQSYVYSAGYYFTGMDGRKYHTIMAYGDDGPGGDEVPYFSSPDYQYAGVAVGDARHDNTRAIRNLFAAVTAFRESVNVDPMEEKLTDVFFSPSSGGVIDRGEELVVELFPAEEDAEVRYTLDGSDPTATSLLYAGPIRLAGTTEVRAISVIDGVAGPVCRAKYFLNDLGQGIGAPHLEWSTSLGAPWSLTADKAYDGDTAVRSDGEPYAKSWLKTCVKGPGRLSFRYCPSFAQASFDVLCDSTSLYHDESEAACGNTSWVPVGIDVPPGNHEIMFSLELGGTYWSGHYNGVHLDALDWTGGLVPSDPVNVLFDDAARVMGDGDVAPYAGGASVYEGFSLDAKDRLAATIQVKVAKGKVNRKTGAFAAKVTATVLRADGTKKITFKGGSADAAGKVTGLTAAGHTLDLTLGVDGMGGTLDGRPIDGARNFFTAKDVGAKAIAAAIERKWLGAICVAGEDVALSVTVAKKGKVKVSGAVNGVKVSAKSQLLIGEENCCIPVVIAKKANLAFNLWLKPDGGVEVGGASAETPSLRSGRSGTLKGGAVFSLDGMLPLAGVRDDLLPSGLPVASGGTKWVVADGVKAANPSGLKLSYKAKDGSFKGSFKVYALQNGRLKSYSAAVTGVLVEGVGYGTATVKKVGRVPVTVAP